MHWHAIEYVVRMQMKALGAITLEDDFYFERWEQKQKQQQQQTASRVPDAVTPGRGRNGGKGGRGGKAPTPQKGPPKGEAKRPIVKGAEAKCRAWADTQRTLGFSSKSNVKAPRKLLDLKSHAAVGTDEKQEKGGNGGGSDGEKNDGGAMERADGMSGSRRRIFNSPFWCCRARIERGWSVVLKLEALAGLKPSPRDASVAASTADALRASLGKLLQLPDNVPMGDDHLDNAHSLGSEGWPMSAPFAWSAGVQLLGSLKGKKLLVRGLPLLTRAQRAALLWVAAGHLAHFLFSRDTSSEHEVVHARMSQALAAAFGAVQVPLGVLLQCLRQITASPQELLLYFLQMPASALILQALLSNGESKCEDNAAGDSDEVLAWQRSLANLQDKVASAN